METVKKSIDAVNFYRENASHRALAGPAGPCPRSAEMEERELTLLSTLESSTLRSPVPVLLVCPLRTLLRVCCCLFESTEFECVVQQIKTSVASFIFVVVLLATSVWKSSVWDQSGRRTT